MDSKQKLGNPYFIIAVLVLLINDWYFKQTYHNQLTGKLSDFAGLFAFAFFFSALLPTRAVRVHLATFVLFLVWKSPLVQPVIDTLNTISIPVQRKVDYSDYWALGILPLSLYVFKASGSYRLKPVLLNVILVCSAFSFVATSMVTGQYTKITGINKTYSFNFSKRDLVSRINSLQLEFVHEAEKNLHSLYKSNNGGVKIDSAWIDFDSKTNMFYYSSTYSKKDTLARILDYEQVKDADTIRLRTMHCDINISGNSTRSEIKLLNFTKFIARTSKSDERQIAVELFEKAVIKKIKSYGK
jgi:hypothetical protein